MDPSNSHVSPEGRDELLRQLLGLLDGDGDGVVSRAEWLQFVADGRTLPDLGTGPGHHGDDEYEYEIHHWEKSVFRPPSFVFYIILISESRYQLAKGLR